jgi:hypothetical protein
MKAEQRWRTQTPSQKIQNDSFPKGNAKTPGKDDGPFLVISAFVLLAILGIIAEIILNLSVATLMAPAAKQGVFVMNDSVDMIGKEKAMWVDWYARGGAGHKEQSDESKR